MGGCPGTSILEHSFDSAFQRGVFTLGEAATVGIANTSCGKCYVSIVSQGSASGSTRKNRDRIIKAITTPPFAELASKHKDALSWSYGGFGSRGQAPISSPLVIKQPNMKKQYAMEEVLKWYASKDIHIDRSRVFFFDDRGDNAAFFAGTGMNSRQISCSHREKNIGYCGATVAEIDASLGVHGCGWKKEEK